MVLGRLLARRRRRGYSEPSCSQRHEHTFVIVGEECYEEHRCAICGKCLKKTYRLKCVTCGFTTRETEKIEDYELIELEYYGAEYGSKSVYVCKECMKLVEKTIDEIRDGLKRITRVIDGSAIYDERYVHTLLVDDVVRAVEAIRDNVLYVVGPYDTYIHTSGRKRVHVLEIDAVIKPGLAVARIVMPYERVIERARQLYSGKNRGGA